MLSKLTALLLCGICLYAQQAPDSKTQQPVFSVGTTLVQVDAEVTDAKQHNVDNLQASDFEVMLDHKVQPIVNFSYVDLQAASASKQSVVNPESVRRCMVIVVDDLGLSFTSMAYVRTALRRFIDRDMQAGDLVALWETGRTNSVFQQLTSDKHLLLVAVDNLRWNPRGRGLLDAFADERPWPGVGVPHPASANGIPNIRTAGESDERAYLTSSLALGTLGTLAELVEELRQVGGRKALILFSDGLPTLPGANERAGGSPEVQAMIDQTRRLIDSASRSGTVIYTIDARGLQYGPPGFAMQVAGDQEALVTIAEETGGFATTNSNDLAGAVERIRQDQKGYYLIGFKAPKRVSSNPKEKLDFHSLRVRVQRRGLHVRSRAGFWGETDEASQGNYKTPERQMALAVYSLFNHNDIHVRLTALYARTAEAQPVVRNLVYIDSRDVKFETNGAGQQVARLDLMVMVSGGGPDPLLRMSRRIDITANDEQLAKFRRQGILLNMNIPVKTAGAYQIRAAVRDENSSALGSAGQFLEIPDLKKVHLALTTPLLADKSAAANPDDPSPALREFHAGSNISFVALLETTRENISSLPAKAFEGNLRLYSDGKLVLSHPIPVANVQGQTVRALKAELRLNNSLPAGQYYLEVAATANTGKSSSSASAWTDFQILPD